MLSNDATHSELFKDISRLVASIGLELVEVSSQDLKNITSMKVFLAKRGDEISTEDLESAYNIIYPRYEVILSNRDLMLEVTSPGLQRNIKSWHELSIFKGRDVRLYSTLHSSYIVGNIYDVDDDKLTLHNYLIEDKKESGDVINLNYKDIAKAKLEYRWEGKNA